MDLVTRHLARWHALATVLFLVGACGSSSVPGTLESKWTQECADGCVIDGTCVGAGTTSPDNPCLACDPSRSTGSFSPRDGHRCDDGAFCTIEDVCRAGVCGGSPRSCDDGVACNGTATCSEADDACLTGVPTCAANQVCDALSGSCRASCTGCLIGEVCHGDGQANPGNPCEVCLVASSRSAWSANHGARCDDGLFCTDGDVCTGTQCGGSARDCSDEVACNGVESCDEASDSCTRGATSCAAGEVCDQIHDLCLTTCSGCVVGGVCFADGSRNPLDQCQICDAARSRTDFSPNDGASCDDGLFCTRNDTCDAGVCAGSAGDFCGDGVACNGVETCNETSDRCMPGARSCGAGEVCDVSEDSCQTTCSGCVIGGVCYAPGTRNPANQCQSCVVAASTSTWTTNTGASCDDGLYCTTGDACTAAAVCTGAARSCSDGVTCNGLETCNETDDRCAAGSSTCAVGQLCDAGQDVCQTTCSGCVIDAVCYAPGTTNPSNACQVCQTSASTSVWTARTGQSCDDGSYCTVGETCSAAAACTGGASRSCDDGVSCNGVESCNEATERCDAGTTRCGAGELCDTSADACVLSCGSGSSACGSACVDTDTDPLHCLGCGNACPTQAHAAAVCHAGCKYLCDSGYANCNTSSPDCEVNTRTDPRHCGGCGAACATGLICSDGACVAPRNYTQTATSASWIEACAVAGHSEYLPNDDDGTVNFPLPFDFHVSGTLRAAGYTASATTNGWLRIGSYIVAHNGDNYGRNPNICTAVVGSAPNRRLVVEWRDQLYYPPGAYSGSHVSYELVLNEADYSIDLIFGSVTAGRSQYTYINGADRGTGGCPGGEIYCLPSSGYATRWTPSR
jgi:hypothetical protein